MAAVFKVNGIDYTSFVLVGKLDWSRNDIDGERTGRTLDGTMFRQRIAKKRTLAVTCKRLTTEQLQSICSALSPMFVDVTYLDPELGETTKTFYSSQISSTTWATVRGVTYWDNAQFNLIEQ